MCLDFKLAITIAGHVIKLLSFLGDFQHPDDVGTIMQYMS